MPTALVLSLVCTAVSTADQQIIQIPASSSGMLHASNCCTMSYMGSANASTVYMRTCQSVYMSCIGSRRAAVWQFDLSGIPDDATLVSARFKGTRPEVWMTGSGFLSMAFDTGPLTSSVCLSLWNGGDWQTSWSLPYGHDFTKTITSGLTNQFNEISTLSILGYAPSGEGTTITNTGSDRPVLEITIDVPVVPCDGDLNDDGVVDGTDISVILGYWGQSDPAYDLDDNGVIDGSDLAVVLGWWGACPK
jgi:hypothetical protein